MIGSIPSLRRHVKNVACNYSDAQVKVEYGSFVVLFSPSKFHLKVREATSNDPWGPSSSLMSEIADMTFNAMAFSEIMQMIWKRLNDHGKNWRHVYKSLVLLDYLIKLGSEKVAQQCRENIYAIQTLKDFQHVEDNKDQGINVREKAKQLVSLLKDEERMKNERSRAQLARRRFTQHGMGISCDGSVRDQQSNIGLPFSCADSELEDCRPSSIGEEELQLRIALALSKEEAQKEEEVRRDDDVRLQLALKQSQAQNEHILSHEGTIVHPEMQTNATDNLLSLQQPSKIVSSSQASPWPFIPPIASNDPWAPTSNYGATTSSSAAVPDPFASPLPAGFQNDPWLPVESNQQSISDAMRQPVATKVDSLSFPTSLDALVQPASESSSSGIAFGTNVAKESFENGTSKEQSLLVDTAAQKRNLRTPESFLGENSSLVNLDNLLGPPKQAASGSNNPFLNSGSGNPFLAQQRPMPTLNEMRSASSMANPMSSSMSTGGQPGSWILPQPLQPQRPSSTNPFL
ncbi:ENTH and UIM domain containing protein [Trichuris trichiura]|uniref:ENTH and UIM domain containing protein n=1 Tax=Trichuris trichiura TaxID=36087 RepID=A0A077Z5H8_TRITR|nr:ENTH and UIM domain containing protein [Trichuris trichiura]